MLLSVRAVEGFVLNMAPPGPVPEDSRMVRHFPSACKVRQEFVPMGLHDGIAPHSGKLILQASPG